MLDCVKSNMTLANFDAMDIKKILPGPGEKGCRLPEESVFMCLRENVGKLVTENLEGFKLCGPKSKLISVTSLYSFLCYFYIRQVI